MKLFFNASVLKAFMDLIVSLKAAIITVLIMGNARKMEHVSAIKAL